MPLYITLGETDNEQIVQLTRFVFLQFLFLFSRAMKYWEPAKIFFDNILSSEGKEKTNVYAYMFLCDFFNFILLIFGFSAFGVSRK